MAVQQRADIVIVGYGAAAGPISTELSKAGYSVVALERGPNRTTADFSGHHFDTLRHRVRNEMIPSIEDSPITFRSDLNARAEPTRQTLANGVGGGSVHWSGQSWRYYEDDFRLRSSLEDMYGPEKLAYLEEDGATIEDWPFSYEDLEPYYDQAEYYVGIGAYPGNIQGDIRPENPDEGNPYEAPRERDFPFRPIRDNATDLTFREGALELGYQPFHVPTAITSEAYTNPDGVERPACSYCTFCTGHGCWNESKSTTRSSLLPTALETGNFEIRPDSHVLSIKHENGQAVSVEYIDLVTGDVHEQPGDVFYLGAFSYHNVRLLLSSGIDGGGQVGRHFLNRTGPSVSGIFDDRYLNGYNGPAVQRQAIEEFNGENNYEEKMELSDEDFFIRGAVITSPSQRNPLQTFGSHPPDVPSWGAEYKEYFTEYLNRFIGLQFVVEPLPYETSYMDLDPNYVDRFGMPALRLQRQAKENEQRMARYLHDRGTEILEAAGASQIWGSPTVQATGTGDHDAGGLRMGEDPSTSATNTYGQLWDFPNIVVGGGALFPSLSGHNPTETIWAVSYRQAHAMVEGWVDYEDSEGFTT